MSQEEQKRTLDYAVTQLQTLKGMLKDMSRVAEILAREIEEVKKSLNDQQRTTPTT